MLEQFPDINKLCNVASYWIYEYIGILLGARPILHISRLKVNLRKRVVQCYIWIMALYDAEKWRLRKIDQNYLESFKIWG
jgi:hypothetical protein